MVVREVDAKLSNGNAIALEGILISTRKTVKKIVKREYLDKDCSTYFESIVSEPIGKKYWVNYDSGWFHSTVFDIEIDNLDGTLKKLSINTKNESGEILKNLAEIIKAVKPEINLGVEQPQMNKLNNDKNFGKKNGERCSNSFLLSETIFFQEITVGSN